MPYASPVENAIALSQAVLHTDKAREMVANYELSSMDVDVELPDYGNLKKPLLEAFTLDSTACAACTYMWGRRPRREEAFWRQDRCRGIHVQHA